MRTSMSFDAAKVDACPGESKEGERDIYSEKDKERERECVCDRVEHIESEGERERERERDEL